MHLTIRQESSKDIPFVQKIIQDSFENEPYSDQTEHHLVARLRQSKTFIPELSLVAELNGEIVGYILLTLLKIKNVTTTYNVLGMAPVSVSPNHQRKGIGGKLILQSHEIAKELGYGAIVLLGHAHYYPRFGYKPTNQYNINLPFEAPAENCMIFELQKGFLESVNGVVVYPQAFFE